MKLLNWIDKTKLNWDTLCKNPNAVELIKEELKLLKVKRTRKQQKQFKSKINWKSLCLNTNPEVIELLKDYPEYINYSSLSLNPNAIWLLRENITKINWYKFSMNPNAGEILNEYLIDDFTNVEDDTTYSDEHKEIYKNIIYNIRWDLLSEYLKDVSILVANPDKIHWDRASSNPNAIDLLETNKDKINYRWASENPNAIHLLVDNLDKADFYKLSSNPNAIYILQNNKDKLDMWELSQNINAIALLEDHIPKIIMDGNPNWINWNTLSLNSNATKLLEKYIDQIENFYFISQNPNAIDLLKINYTKINWTGFSQNPAIFTENEKNNSILDNCCIM